MKTTETRKEYELLPGVNGSYEVLRNGACFGAILADSEDKAITMLEAMNHAQELELINRLVSALERLRPPCGSERNALNQAYDFLEKRALT